jgi:hypothetical protein
MFGTVASIFLPERSKTVEVNKRINFFIKISISIKRS